jgi:hypothetical protein
MRFDVKALALTCGIFWGATVLIATVWLLVLGFEGEVIRNLDHFYFGYSFSYVGAVIGAIWGFVDGAICGAIFAWLYNKLAGAQRAPN